MSEPKSWDEVKGERSDSAERRRGYQEAKGAYELGARVRAERERALPVVGQAKEKQALRW